MWFVGPGFKGLAKTQVIERTVRRAGKKLMARKQDSDQGKWHFVNTLTVRYHRE